MSIDSSKAKIKCKMINCKCFNVELFHFSINENIFFAVLMILMYKKGIVIIIGNHITITIITAIINRL